MEAVCGPGLITSNWMKSAAHHPRVYDTLVARRGKFINKFFIDLFILKNKSLLVFLGLGPQGPAAQSLARVRLRTEPGTWLQARPHGRRSGPHAGFGGAHGLGTQLRPPGNFCSELFPDP